MAVINNSINNTLQTPFNVGSTSVTTTGTQLNYLSGATSVSGSGALVLNAATSGANSNITSLTGLTGVIQGPTFINDSSGNHVAQFISGSTSVNWVNIASSPTGSGVAVVADGADTNIPIYIRSKGTANVIIATGSTMLNIITENNGFSNQFVFPSRNGIFTLPNANGTLCIDTSSSGSITTTPPASSSSSLIIGTAYQNTAGYDVIVTVYISVTAATVGSLSLGVGPTITPTQQTIVSSLTVAAVTIIPVTIYLPNNYYALLSTGGTITAAISGQQAMPV